MTITQIAQYFGRQYRKANLQLKRGVAARLLGLGIALAGTSVTGQEVQRLPAMLPPVLQADPAAAVVSFHQLVDEQTRHHEDLQHVHTQVEELSLGDLNTRLQALETAREKELAAAAKKKAEDALKPSAWRMAGRIHADYWAFPETSPGANAFETGDPANSVDDRFLFRRVRLAIAGQVPDNMVYAMQVDFNNPNSPQIKDVFLGWNELPVLQTLLVGNQKRPYGLDHINSSNNNIFLERPFVVEAFNQDSRRFGIQSYGVSDDLAWNWRYGTFLQQDLQNVGTILTTPLDEDYQAEVAGRLANTFWYDESSDGRGYGHWAVAGTIASPDGNSPNSTARFQTRPEARTSTRWLDTDTIAGGETYELLATEHVLNFGSLQLVSEYQHVWMQRDRGNPDVQFDGAYIYAAYFLTGEYMPWDRETGSLARVTPLENFFLVNTCDGRIDGGWGAWQVAVRYSYGDFTDQDVLGGEGEAWTYGLVWWWNARARMQFNYIDGEIDQHEPVAGLTRGKYDIIGTRFHIDF